MDYEADDELPEQFDGGEALIGVPIDWYVPDGMVPKYATNIVVQHTEHEFIISFFELTPPIILGSPEEQRQRAAELGSVRANCLARIIISARRMPEFLEVLEGNLQTWRDRFEEGEADE